MKWQEKSGDKDNGSGPPFHENRQYHSHRFLGSAPDELGRNGHAGLVSEDKVDYFLKLSQFTENLQRMESSSKKFQWESLFAMNPAYASSKSSLGLKNDNDNQKIELSGSHYVPKSSSSNIGAIEGDDGADAVISYGIDDYSYEPSDVLVRDHHPMFESARASDKPRQKEIASQNES